MRAIPKAQRLKFKYNGNYSFVADAYEGRLPADSLSTYKRLSAAHNDLIERAVRRTTVSLWLDAHSPSVMAVLRDSGFQVRPPTQAIKTKPNSTRGRQVLDDIDLLDNVTIEGRKILRQHLVPERNQALVKRKKEIVLKSSGCLTCEVCAFDFEKCYGALGENFVEVHHKVPLADFKRARKFTVSDLAIVCSNCHRMLHRVNPLLTLTELAKLHA